MKKLFLFLFLSYLTLSSGAQVTINRDPEIKKMVDEISKEKIELYVRKLVSFHTRHNLSVQNDPSVGIGAAWNWIKSEFDKNIEASGGRLEVKFEEYSVGGKGQRIPHQVKLKNVVATLKGTDPSDGAKFMATKAKQENLNIIAMINNDMIGNSGSSETLINDNTRVRVFSEAIPAFETGQMAAMRKSASGENDSKARELARHIKEVGERYVEQINVTLVFRNDRFGRGGDHTPFCQEGFTAVRICEYNENYDRTHKIPGIVNGIQEGDLPEYVDYEYVRKNAGINLATIANLALAPYEPVNCVIVTGKLTNKTTLRWESPSKGIKPAGYYILMRETFQPLWEKKVFVAGNEATIPYSKDNYFFGIQSVDAAGHESIPVFPGQARRQDGPNN